MPEGLADQQNADQQNADLQTADQGGGGSTSSTSPTPPANTGGAAMLVYVTMPLQIGVNNLGFGSVNRIEWRQYATRPMLVLCLQDANGVPLNLTGATSVTLRICAALGGTTVISEAMTVLYANGGQVGYLFQAGDVATSGTFHLEVEVVGADGSPLYLPSSGYVLFIINPSLGGP